MILEVDKLCFRYPNTKRTILKDVSFSLDHGEVLSILGANGAGKSTMLNCIANLYSPVSGEIRLHGKPMKDLSMTEVARLIGYVPQIHTPTYAYSVREFVVMGRTPYIGTFSKPSAEDYDIAENAIESLGISHLIDKDYSRISGGERQMVTIARAIAQQPEIILMDEPTAHLDYGNQYRTVEMIARLAEDGFALLMTTHNPDHAIILNGKVAVLNQKGVLGVGMASETLTDGLLSNLYGLRIKTVYDDDARRKICIVY